MTNTNYDSDFCGSLPIQLINLIQSYGVLIVVERSTQNIIQVSENAGEVFGKPFQELLNTPLHTYLTNGSGSQEENWFQEGTDKVPSVWKIMGKSYLTLVHSRELFHIIEIDLGEYEETKQASFVRVYQEIKYAMSVIQASESIDSVAENCVKQIRRITGYDKVMVYCFDKEWNGTVIAEEREQGMESYLGITFPASDVPRQARLLYHKNPFRMIPTREYQPVKLYPVLNPLTRSFVDLSDCNLRSVAAVHLEYLGNMNVMSSMSARILNGEKLWGLIACHHKTPKMLSFEMRSVVEMLSNIVSARITSLQNNELHAFSLRIKEQYKNMVEEAYRKDDWSSALLQGDPDLLTLFNASGAAVTMNGKIHSKGNIPDGENMRELILWLHAKQLKHIYYTDCLPFEYDQAQDFRDIASGIMAIPVSYESDGYVLLFRPEAVRVINWGGNPEEGIQFEENTKNYHPRSSFKKWQQLVKGFSKSWRDEEVTAAENLRSFIFEFSSY